MKTADDVLELVDQEMKKFYNNLMHYEMNLKSNLLNMKLYCAAVSELLESAYKDTIANLEEKEKLGTCTQLIFVADEIVVNSGTFAGELMKIIKQGIADETENGFNNSSLETLRKSLGAALSKIEDKQIKLQDREDIFTC